MRGDMHKVIVNRPRRGVHQAPRVKLRLDPSPDRASVGMKRAAKEQVAWTKGFNDHLNPLKRYLWKQRGRPWNKVYGEICAALDGRSTVKQHLHDHLDDFILRRVIADRDGRWYGHHRWGGQTPLEECWQRLYVDPRDGIIKETGNFRRKLGLPETRRWVRPSPPSADDKVVLSSDRELRRIAGIWYRIRFDQRPGQPPRARVFDLLTRQRVWPGQRHAVMKRQLSKVELDSFGLSNSL